jgi:excinuclease ABC subunit A
VLQYVDVHPCPVCHGTGLQARALAVRYAGRSISDLTGLPLTGLAEVLREAGSTGVAATLVADLLDRIEVLTELGLGYLSTARATPTLSAGELQRLRLATALHSNLFGVLYVLDEPSAGLHPADTEPLLGVLARLRAAGNSLLVVEHDVELMRQADWLVDVGPGAGTRGGRVLHSGPVDGLADVVESVTRPYLFSPAAGTGRELRKPGWTLSLRGVTLHNLRDLDVDLPMGVFTAVTGVSGSGKSTLVTQVLADAVRSHLGADGLVAVPAGNDADDEETDDEAEPVVAGRAAPQLAAVDGLEPLTRLVLVDQRPIGRTPRSNLATYTGLFDGVRSLFAATDAARQRGYAAGRFSFNVAGGRCENCQGEGFVAVELLFLPGSYAPCPVCEGARYNLQTLEVRYRDRNVAEVLAMTVDDAAGFFPDVPAVARSLETLRAVGLGYLTLGQPATELSGGEAQRIKLATELQRARRGHTLYVLDEPTAGLHPADVALLTNQLHDLVSAGSSVVVVEHDLEVVAGADWVVDLGPGGGDDGGRVVAAGTPAEVAASTASRTAPYLAAHLAGRLR